MVWKEAVGPSLPSATGGQGAGISEAPPSNQGAMDLSLDPARRESKSRPPCHPPLPPPSPARPEIVPSGLGQLHSFWQVTAKPLPYSTFRLCSGLPSDTIPGPRPVLSRSTGARVRGQDLCPERAVPRKPALSLQRAASSVSAEASVTNPTDRLPLPLASFRHNLNKQMST